MAKRGGEEKKNYARLKKLALQEGADLFGVALLTNYQDEVQEEIRPILNKLTFGISMGVSLSKTVLKTIKDKPTLIYSWHYRQINSLLDHIALRLAKFIQSENYASLPIAASQVVDWQKQKAHLGHKHLAWLAGLGWIGRNNLLVNEKYGAGLRLVSILTDMPLVINKPKDLACGECFSCIAICPAKAIKEKSEDFQHKDCFLKLTEFSRLPGIKYHICGICVQSCQKAFDK